MTTTDKVNYIMSNSETLSTKHEMSKELDLSRPTFNSRMDGKTEWRKLEVNYINKLFNELK